MTGPLAAEARAFALERHGADGAAHPAEAGAILADAGERDEIVAAGLLHDLVEDTGTTVAEVRARFGDHVVAMVDALTEDPSIQDYVERKAALRAKIAGGGRNAAVVSAADKLSKIRHLPGPGLGLSDDKAEHYAETVAMVAATAPGHPLTVALADEWQAAQGAG